MKTKILFITLLLLIVGCSKSVEDSTLIKKEGLMYLPDSDSPYSGEVFTNYDTGEKEYQGTYENGLLVEYSYLNKDGSVKEPVNGETLIDRSGLLYEVNGQKPYTGDVFELYDDGSRKHSGSLKGGKKDKLWTEWYENGQKKDEWTFKDGKKDGLWTSWYENGQNKIIGNYYDGYEGGLFSYFDINGKKKEDRNYSDKGDYYESKKFYLTGEDSLVSFISLEKQDDGTFKENNVDIWTTYSRDGEILQELDYNLFSSPHLFFEGDWVSINSWSTTSQSTESGCYQRSSRFSNPFVIEDSLSTINDSTFIFYKDTVSIDLLIKKEFVLSYELFDEKNYDIFQYTGLGDEKSIYFKRLKNNFDIVELYKNKKFDEINRLLLRVNERKEILINYGDITLNPYSIDYILQDGTGLTKEIERFLGYEYSQDILHGDITLLDQNGKKVFSGSYDYGIPIGNEVFYDENESIIFSNDCSNFSNFENIISTMKKYGPWVPIGRRYSSRESRIESIDFLDNKMIIQTLDEKHQINYSLGRTKYSESERWKDVLRLNDNNLSKEDELWTKKPFNDLRIKEEFRGFSPKIEISSLMFDQQSQFSQDHWLNKSDFLSDFFVRYVPKEIKLWIDNLPNRMKMKEDSW